MANINEVTCLFSTAPNTGMPACVFKSSPDTNDIFIPATSTLTASNITTAVVFQTYLQTQLILDDPSLRWYSPGEFVNPNDGGKGKDVTKDTAANGAEFVALEPTAIWNRQFKESSSCLQASLLQFDGGQTRWDILRVQKRRFILGQKVLNTSTGATEIGGYKPQLIYVSPMDEATYTTVSASHMEFTYLNPKQDQSNFAVIDAQNIDLQRILRTYRVQSVSLSSASAPTTSGVFVLYGSVGCGSTNFFKTYQTAITAASVLATNGTSGASLAITSIAINPVTGFATVTLTTPPTAGTPVNFSLAAVSVNSALGIKYVESPIPVQINEF